MASGRLKPGWTRVAFGDVARQVKDHVDPVTEHLRRYVAGEHMDTDELRIGRWGTVGDGYLGPAFHMRFRPGHVLYGSRRTYLRKVAVAEFEGVTANTTFVIENRDPDVLLPELLPFIMQTESFHEHSIEKSKGSVNPYVNFSDIAAYEFALPALDEQHRMANVLSAVTEACQTFSGVDHALRQAELSAVQTQLNGNERRPAVPVADLLLEPPRNGISASPISLSEGLRHARMKTVSVSAVDRGRFDPAHAIKHVGVDAATARPFLVQDGDAFVVRGNGNRGLCGQAGLAEASYDDLVYPDLLIRLRFDPTRILPAFAVAQWNLPPVHRELSARAKSTNGIWKVNGQDVRVHELVVPALSEQRRSLRVITRMRNLRGMELKRRADGLARVRSILLNSWAPFGE